jgi:lipoprotein-anchoring transpeptidase ErfK/SrfK
MLLRTMRVTRSLLAAVLAGSLLASPAAASVAPSAPPGDEHLSYQNGLGAGTVLGGQLLPMDWSQRVVTCDDGSRFRVRLGYLPTLCPGDISQAVAHLQSMLSERKLYRGEVTGIYDEATRYAVVTFHKLVGPSHSNPASAVTEWKADPPPEDWGGSDWKLLADFEPRPPKYRAGQPDRVEVDIGHQVLYLIEGNEVAAIMPVSTGAGRGTIGCRNSDTCGVSVTPRTTRMLEGSAFYYQHDYGNGWSPRPGEWSIYKAIFYRGNYGEWNYGLHGYRHVPSYPASHGCIRLTVWDMDFLRPSDGTREWGSFSNGRVDVGMTIHVWDR